VAAAEGGRRTEDGERSDDVRRGEGMRSEMIIIDTESADLCVKGECFMIYLIAE